MAGLLQASTLLYKDQQSSSRRRFTAAAGNSVRHCWCLICISFLFLNISFKLLSTMSIEQGLIVLGGGHCNTISLLHANACNWCAAELVGTITMLSMYAAWTPAVQLLTHLSSAQLHFLWNEIHNQVYGRFDVHSTVNNKCSKNRDSYHQIHHCLVLSWPPCFAAAREIVGRRQRKGWSTWALMGHLRCVLIWSFYLLPFSLRRMCPHLPKHTVWFLTSFQQSCLYCNTGTTNVNYAFDAEVFHLSSVRYV